MKSIKDRKTCPPAPPDTVKAPQTEAEAGRRPDREGGALGSSAAAPAGGRSTPKEYLVAGPITAPPPPGALPETVSAGALAALLGLGDSRRVRELAETGIVSRTGRGEYPLAPSVRAYCEHLRASQSDDPADAEFRTHRAALYKERARDAKRRADLIEGRAIDSRVLRGVLTDLFASVRARLLALPTRAAPVCADEPDPVKVCALLDEEVRTALADLADPSRDWLAGLVEKHREAARVEMPGEPPAATDDDMPEELE